MFRQLIIEIICALLILLFVYTAVSKLYDQQTFRMVLKDSPLIGRKADFISWFIPVTELLAAALLMFPQTKILGLYNSALLMILFTCYLGYMIVFTPNLPCNCGGVLQAMTWKQHLVFNMVITLLAVAGILILKGISFTNSNEILLRNNRK